MQNIYLKGVESYLRGNLIQNYSAFGIFSDDVDVWLRNRATGLPPNQHMVLGRNVFEFVNNYLLGAGAIDVHLQDGTGNFNLRVHCGYNRFNDGSILHINLLPTGSTLTGLNCDDNDWRPDPPKTVRKSTNITLGGSQTPFDSYVSANAFCGRSLKNVACYTGTINSAFEGSKQSAQSMDSSERGITFGDYYRRIMSDTVSSHDRRKAALEALHAVRFQDSVDMTSQLDSLAAAYDSLLASRSIASSLKKSLRIARGELAEMQDDSSLAYSHYRQIADLEEPTMDSLIAGWRLHKLGFSGREPGVVYDSLESRYSYRVYSDIIRHLSRTRDSSSQFSDQRPLFGLTNVERLSISFEAFPNPYSG